MFCPQCGAQNESKQAFCRQCGQPLRSIQLALDRRVDEAVAKFSRAEDLLAAGLLIFCIIFLGAFVSLFLTGSIPFVISVILGFLISLPLVLTGLVRIDRVRRTLNPKDEASDKLLEPSAVVDPILPATPTPNQLGLNADVFGSVTEDTTARLKTPKLK